MPKLGQYSDIAGIAFYLYDTRDDAIAGKKTGGTGFLVSVPSTRWPSQVRLVHAVTNWHVARCGSPVVRLNTSSGKPAIFDWTSDEWVYKPGGPDIAVSPPLKWDDDFKAIPADVSSFLLTAEAEVLDEVGPADDVFMVGRFVDYDGEETNSPAIRFGHISIMDAKILQETGYCGRSIVIDMHSRSGFSGSPVFIYRTLGSYFLPAAQPGQFLSGGGHYLKLLGIHWGQFPELWEIVNPSKPRAEKNAALIKKGAYIKGLSGMTCVIPAEEIYKLIYSPELVAMREKEEKVIAAKHGDKLRVR